MEVQLDSKGNFRLVSADDSFPFYCIWSGECYGGEFVVIRSRNPEDNTFYPTCELHISSVSQFVSGLERILSGDFERGDSISPSGVVKYKPEGESLGIPVSCAVCRGNITDTDESLSLSKHSAIHTQCIPDFINIVKRVWNHSDRIIIQEFS